MAGANDMDDLNDGPGVIVLRFNGPDAIIEHRIASCAYTDTLANAFRAFGMAIGHEAIIDYVNAEPWDDHEYFERKKIREEAYAEGYADGKADAKAINGEA